MKGEIDERLIFGGKHDGDMWRYSTWDEALAGHNEICVIARLRESRRLAALDQ